MYAVEKERKLYPDDPYPQASFINIDVDSNSPTKPINQRARPRHFTTPKQGGFDYEVNFIFGQENKEEEKEEKEKEKGKNAIEHPNFRRYRMQVESIMTRLNMRGRDATVKSIAGCLNLSAVQVYTMYQGNVFLFVLCFIAIGLYNSTNNGLKTYLKYYYSVI